MPEIAHIPLIVSILSLMEENYYYIYYILLLYYYYNYTIV